ncbi:MAG: glycosyltransferase family 4 protein [Verrucomicrobia bacterium]|nr:glycosyltransferase family 4 protein [Verrucomicrobiota bacterium]
MRFLMLNWRDPRNPLAGGAERVTQGYLTALAERGHEVFWFANDFPDAAPEEQIGPLRILRGGGIGRSILHAIRWYRRQPGFDLVIDQHHGIPWYAPWWCRTRCVAYIHEVLGPIWDAFYPWPRNAIGRCQERWTHWLYRHVPFWTACQSTRDCLRSHGVRDITIIPYGVHTVALPALDDKPLGTPLRLIAVSRLAPNKRIDHAIRALHRAAQLGLDAELTIVGSGLDEAPLKRLVAALDLDKRVRFTGLLAEPDKDAALRRAHFLVHTSQREGWGLNVIEANAMGTPAIVYPVPGLTESTLHGQTGVVSEAETPESLAAAIQAASQAPEAYQQYRRRAWERARTYHWNVVLPQACAWLERQAQLPKRP